MGGKCVLYIVLSNGKKKNPENLYPKLVSEEGGKYAGAVH